MEANALKKACTLALVTSLEIEAHHITIKPAGATAESELTGFATSLTPPFLFRSVCLGGIRLGGGEAYAGRLTK
ncbi:hypothetical protein Q7C36_009135 [Tachysurus vachellii]|uniref:Uncharacterized protein n=1 Tax=Tachysurus vachellii TaxID=175792 RepID=A0AA88SY33_TACVA|nr:hypothetical protein Q7C36_009135 [Tachysurus vachellii]